MEGGGGWWSRLKWLALLAPALPLHVLAATPSSTGSGATTRKENLSARGSESHCGRLLQYDFTLVSTSDEKEGN